MSATPENPDPLAEALRLLGQARKENRRLRGSTSYLRLWANAQRQALDELALYLWGDEDVGTYGDALEAATRERDEERKRYEGAVEKYAVAAERVDELTDQVLALRGELASLKGEGAGS